MKVPYFLIFITAVVSAVSANREQLNAPIYIANQNPFVQVFGLPKSEAGHITPKGKLDAGFLYYVSNGAIISESGSESIAWDGETAQYNLRFRYGVLDHLELGIDVPFIQQSGGFLDSTIRHFHDLFSFPNDRQEDFGKNKIRYDVSDLTSPPYEMAGLGDIRITAAIPLAGNRPDARRFLSLRSLLKLPTGDADYLLGSGGTDFSAGFAYSDYQTLKALNLLISLSAGAMYMGDSDVLGDLQKKFAGYGSASLGWQLLKQIDLKIQLDTHSAMYDSGLKQLGSSVQLTSGAAVYLPRNVVVDLGMSQNLITDATPDVGFYLFVRHQF